MCSAGALISVYTALKGLITSLLYIYIIMSLQKTLLKQSVHMDYFYDENFFAWTFFAEMVLFDLFINICICVLTANKICICLGR